MRLLDFNPVGGTTSPILFDWADLPYGEQAADITDSDVEHMLEFRIVTDPVGVKPNLAVYGMPYDLVDRSAEGAIADLMRQTQQDFAEVLV